MCDHTNLDDFLAEKSNNAVYISYRTGSSDPYCIVKIDNEAIIRYVCLFWHFIFLQCVESWFSAAYNIIHYHKSNMFEIRFSTKSN